jgi:hypothetical protein
MMSVGVKGFGCRVELRSRHFVEHHCVGSWHSAITGEAVVGSRATTEALAAGRHTPASLSQKTRTWLAQAGVAHH